MEDEIVKDKEPINLDTILTELGQFGRYQIIIFCYILLPTLLSAAYNAQYIFAAGDLNYRCKVPQCEIYPLELTPAWGVWALPDDGRCQNYRPTGAGCSPDDFHKNETEACNSWFYESNNTIVAEFDLACQEWKRTLVGTIHSVGLFVALLLTSFISDTYGRRFAFVLTATAPAVVGFARTFSPNYIMYLVLEFLDSTVGSGVFSTGFILGLEMVGVNRRVLGGSIIFCIWALGQVSLALASWGLPHWKTMTRAIYLPSILFIFYYFVIEESIRWLLSKGRKQEAAKIIFKAAEINKKKLSPETINMLTHTSSVDSKMRTKEVYNATAPKPKKRSTMMMVFKSKIMVARLCICSFWWITAAFIYYGLSINSVSLAGNMYMNYILTSLVEIPGYCLSILTLDRFGRKKSIISAFFVCGISLIALPFIPNELGLLQAGLTMLGKLCISMVFSSIYVYTSELFPTEVRHRCIATCSMFGRIGGILAPQTPLLMAVMASLVYLIFGVMAFTAGLLMLLTPETLNMRLPDTVEQAQSMVKPQTNGTNRASVLVN